MREQVLTGDFPGGLKDLATERARRAARRSTAVFAKWIQAADFDGFRIDTLKHVEHEFWQYFAPAFASMRRQDPARRSAPAGQAERDRAAATVPKQKFFMFGESFDGDDDLNGSYTQNQEVDSTFYFSQKFSACSTACSKTAGRPSAIADQFKRKQMLRTRRCRTTDGIGIASTQAMVNFLDNHDVPRFLFDKPSLPALYNALAFLFTEDGHSLRLLRHRAGVLRRQRSDQPRAAVGHAASAPTARPSSTSRS